MKDIDLFMPRVLGHVPAVAQPRAYRAIRDAARVVCERTKLWRESDEVAITTPEHQVLTTVTDGAIEAIEWARFDDTDLEPKTVAWLDENEPGWQIAEDEAAPRYITQVSPQSVSIYPRKQGTLHVRYLLKPTETATTLHDALYELHAGLIGKYAAADILGDANKDYTNPARAADLMGEFERELNRIAYRIARGQQGGKIRTKAQFL